MSPIESTRHIIVDAQKHRRRTVTLTIFRQKLSVNAIDFQVFMQLR